MYSLALISGQNLSIKVPIWSGKLAFQIAMVAFQVRQSAEKKWGHYVVVVVVVDGFYVVQFH